MLPCASSQNSWQPSRVPTFFTLFLASSKHTFNWLRHFAYKCDKPSADAFVELAAVDPEASVVEQAGAVIGWNLATWLQTCHAVLTASTVNVCIKRMEQFYVQNARFPRPPRGKLSYIKFCSPRRTSCALGKLWMERAPAGDGVFGPAAFLANPMPHRKK